MESLQKHIGRKYGFWIKGLQSFEVENLLMEGIVGFRKAGEQIKLEQEEKQEERHTHTSLEKRQQQNEQQQYLLKLKGAIINYIIEKGKFIENENQAAEKDVKEAIMYVTGNKDSRPIRNDLNLLIARGLLARGHDIGLGKNRTKTILISAASQEHQEQQDTSINIVNAAKAAAAKKELDDAFGGYEVV
jgi:hypothetical protein